MKWMRSSGSWYVAAAAVLMMLGSGCDNSTTNLPQGQAQSIAVDLSLGALQALESSLPQQAAAKTSRHAHLLSVASTTRPQVVSGGCTPNSSGDEVCDIGISATTPCTYAGTATFSGSATGTLDPTYTGDLVAAITETPNSAPNDCYETSSTLFLNGDPDVTFSSPQVPINQGVLAFPFTLTEQGRVSYGPTPSGSCQLNMTFTITGATSTSNGVVFACTYSGLACGQPLSGSCPAPPA